MLEDLSELQESEEDLYATTTLSFTFYTRSVESNELIHKEYTFDHAKEWDKWTLIKYSELRCDADSATSEREWRRTRQLKWSDTEETPEIDIPPEVTEELKERLGVDEITLQLL